MIRDNPIAALKGVVALLEALDKIGTEGVTDHDLARSVVVNETELRELARWALAELAVAV